MTGEASPRCRVLALVLCGLALAACRDAPVAPTPSAEAIPIALSASHGEVSPYGCFVSAAMPAGAPYRYRYRKPVLRFPAAARAADGAATAYRFRLWGASREEPVYVANCLIPATPRAVRLMHRAFGVRAREGEAGEATLMGETCVTRGPCLIEGLEVNACQNGNEWPECEEEAAPARPVEPELAPCYPALGDCGGGGAGGGDSACLTCTLASAVLRCGVNVNRGDWLTCGVSGDSIRSVGRWRWEAADGSARVDGPTGQRLWEGRAVKAGRVSVSVSQPGRTDTLRASFAVTGRGWTWATHAESEYRDGTGEKCLNTTPGPGSDDPYDIRGAMGLNLEIGAPCSPARSMIQPDSDPANGDGFVTATVPSGPNQGLHYVVSAALRLRRESTYNLGLEPGAPRVPLMDVPGYADTDFVHSQRTMCGEFANWYEFTTCMYVRYGRGESPALYLAGLRAHEGRGTTGHNGHYSAAYDAIANPAVDPMVYFDNEVGSSSITREQFTDGVRREFQRRARIADEASLDVKNGGTIVTGNWTGRLWLWLPLERRFTLTSHSN